MQASYTDGLDPPFPAARVACAAAPHHGRRPAARRLALPVPRLVASLSLPAPPVRALRAVAHAHGLRRGRRRAAGGGCRALRALGGARAVIDAPIQARSAVGPAADELTRLA